MAEHFEAGDSVRTVGGRGPEMLFHRYDKAGKAVCSWWKGENPMEHAFDPAVLTKVVTDEGQAPWFGNPPKPWRE